MSVILPIINPTVSKDIFTLSLQTQSLPSIHTLITQCLGWFLAVIFSEWLSITEPHFLKSLWRVQHVWFSFHFFNKNFLPLRLMSEALSRLLKWDFIYYLFKTWARMYFKKVNDVTTLINSFWKLSVSPRKKYFSKRRHQFKISTFSLIFKNLKTLLVSK